MTEIVRMTSQMHPLEMGVPLYPFSHSGVFPITKDGSGADHPGAPLPDSASYDEQPSPPPASLRGIGATPPISSLSVPMPAAAAAAQAVDMMGWHPRSSSSPAGRAVMGVMHAAAAAAHATSYPH